MKLEDFVREKNKTKKRRHFLTRVTNERHANQLSAAAECARQQQQRGLEVQSLCTKFEISE